MFEKMIRSNSAKMEQQLEDWLDKYSAEHPFPPDVRMQADIDYAGDGAPCHRMDLYLPAEARAGCKLPVLFNIHGGGFLLGKKRSQPPILCGYVPPRLHRVLRRVPARAGR